MYQRKRRNADVRFGSLDDGSGRYSLGITTLKRIAQEQGALVRIGRRVLVDFEKMDAYFKALAADQR